MDNLLFYSGLITSVVVTVVLAIIGVRGVNKEDSSNETSFFLLPKALSQSELIATLASTNTALALIVFWFSYLGWLYGLGAAFWLSLCWIAGLEMFAFFQKKWKDFPTVDENGTIKYQTLHDYISPEKGDWARRLLALVSIVSFLLMTTIELTRGMKIIDFIPQSESSTIRDLVAFIIILSAGIYSAYGGFKSAVKTDFYQWFFTIIALLIVFFIAFYGIRGKENLFGSVYYPENFNLKSFFLIPTQPYFIIGSLFSWSFWFFVTMDMWQRAASARKIKIVTLKTRAYLYPWFIFLSVVSVIIGLYVRVNTLGRFDIYFPVVDFMKIAFSQPWTSTFLKYIFFSLIFAGFVTAMVSTIDTYLVVITHSIFRDIPNRDNLNSISNLKFSRLFIGVVVVGISLVIFPLFLLVYHTNFSINALLYLATSAPFIILPAIFMKNKRNKSVSLITSVIFGIIGVTTMIFYVLHQISIAQPTEIGHWYDIMYLIPMAGFLFALLGYLLSYPFNKKAL